MESQKKLSEGGLKSQKKYKYTILVEQEILDILQIY